MNFTTQILIKTLKAIFFTVLDISITQKLNFTGIFEDSNCGSGGRGHAALIVGYTPEAWIIKNRYVY